MKQMCSKKTDSCQMCWLFLLTFLLMLQTGCSAQKVVWRSSEDGDVGSSAATLQAEGSEEKAASGEVAGKSGEATVGAAAIEEELTEEPLTVHVCGAVREPGVYQLSVGARVIDAVEAAGGFTDEADQDWGNQARLIADEEQIRIYTREETAQMPQESAVSSDVSASSSAADGKININTASAEQLQTLPGIGESRAQAIVAWRQEHGAFSSIEEIMNISGIKTAVFEKIKDKISV